MAPDGERPFTAAALQGFEDPEGSGEGARHRRQVAGGSRPPVQHGHAAPGGSVRPHRQHGRTAPQRHPPAMATCYLRSAIPGSDMREPVPGDQLRPEFSTMSGGSIIRALNRCQQAAFAGKQRLTYTSQGSVHETPGEKPRLGGITKAGNSHARRVLVEGAWAYRHPARISYQLQRRVERAPAFAQEIAWKAQVRLCKRFHRLVARGKHPNQVTIAIAREMAAFLWDIARQVPVAI